MYALAVMPLRKYLKMNNGGVIENWYANYAASSGKLEHLIPGLTLSSKKALHMGTFRIRRKVS